MGELLNLLYVQSRELFEEGKFKDIIDLLNDKVLEQYQDAELYAWRARANYRTEQDEDALFYAQKAIAKDDKYWMGYLARGTAYEHKGDHDKAILDFNKAIELRPNDVLIYINRGISWISKNDYDRAIADFNKVIETYPDSRLGYINRGTAWGNKGEYDKALIDYNKVIELKPDDVDAYNNRGITWKNKGEFDKSILDYNKAIDLKPSYTRAYYNRALSYERLGDLYKAIDDYNTCIELNFNISNSRSRIGTLKERLTTSLPDEAKSNITRVTSLVNAIRQKSETGKKIQQVVHYSKLFVADLVTKDCQSRLHYSNVIYMNDPQEGKTFLEYLNDSEITEWYGKSSYRNESAIFLGSFLPVNNDDNDMIDSAEDQLLMWRTYGKDEKGNDAGGCNFVIDTSFFETEEVKTKTSLPSSWNEIQEMINRNIAIIDEDKNRLLNVQYIRKNKIITDKDQTIAKLIELLKEEIRKHIKEKDVNFQADKEIFDSFQELCHLFKSADYSFEREVRVIRAESRNNDNIEYYKEYKDDLEKEPTPPRHFYVRSEKRLLPYLKKIYLGPKVKNPNHWSLHFDYSLRKALKKEIEEKDEMKSLDKIIAINSSLIDVDKKGKSTIRLSELKRLYTGVNDLSKEEIKPNEIEIIPSKCRFV